MLKLKYKGTYDKFCLNGMICINQKTKIEKV